MCNLNFLIKTNNKKADPQNDVLNAYNSACFNSFVENSDNEGFYFDHKNIIMTSDQKINLFENMTLFNNSNFVLGHERFSTSGFSLDYAQPFKKDNFVFIHNGVVGEYAKDGHSDTYNLFNNFLKHFTRYIKSMARPTAIKKSIEKILKNKYGSFSIGIFDIEKQTLFYFKNESTSIYAIKNKRDSMLYLTTKNQNIDFLEIGNSDFKPFEIKNNTLYSIKITSKNKISIKSKGILNFQIKPAKKEKDFYPMTYPDTYKKSIKYEKDKNEVYDLEFFKKANSIKRGQVPFLCEICKTPTYNTKGDYYGIFCNSCLCELEDLV